MIREEILIELKRLGKLVWELKQNNTRQYKLAVLKRWGPLIPDVFFTIINPAIVFNVTAAQIAKTKTPLLSDYSLGELLNKLVTRTLTGDAALEACASFVHTHENDESKEFLLSVFDKKLNIGCSVATVNAAIPGKIAVYEVALAERYSAARDENRINDSWTIQRKIDGCRTTCFIYKDHVTFYSRQHKPFTTLSLIEKELLSLNLPEGTVIDGEVALVNAKGQEDFNSVVSEIRKKGFTMQSPKLIAFDILTFDIFAGNSKSEPYTQRFSHLKKVLPAGLKYIRVVESINYTKKNYADWLDLVSINNWEGLMLKADTPYESGRTHNMLKVKQFADLELVCTGVVPGKIQVVAHGVSTNVQAVTALTFVYKGNILYSGSGLTVAQRLAFLKDPSLVIGHAVTIKYFEETTNKDGQKSLRFPIIKHIYETNRRTV